MRWTALLAVLTVASGCSTEGKPTPKQDAAAGAGQAPAPSGPTAPESANSEAETAELSDADKTLIAADPATLSKDQRRERAQAIRRKVMLTPDGATARAIEDMQQAIRDGKMEPPNKDRNYPTLSLPGEPVEGGSPPAGTPREETPAKAQ